MTIRFTSVSAFCRTVWKQQLLTRHVQSEGFNQTLLFTALGIVPSPFDCYQVNRSLKTLALRMKEHMKNALIVGEYLEKHPLVTKVLFPGKWFPFLGEKWFCHFNRDNFLLRFTFTSSAWAGEEAVLWCEWYDVVLSERRVTREPKVPQFLKAFYPGWKPGRIWVPGRITVSVRSE